MESSGRLCRLHHFLVAGDLLGQVVEHLLRHYTRCQGVEILAVLTTWLKGYLANRYTRANFCTYGPSCYPPTSLLAVVAWAPCSKNALSAPRKRALLQQALPFFSSNETFIRSKRSYVTQSDALHKLIQL